MFYQKGLIEKADTMKRSEYLPLGLGGKELKQKLTLQRNIKGTKN